MADAGADDDMSSLFGDFARSKGKDKEADADAGAASPVATRATKGARGRGSRGTRKKRKRSISKQSNSGVVLSIGLEKVSLSDEIPLRKSASISIAAALPRPIMRPCLVVSMYHMFDPVLRYTSSAPTPSSCVWNRYTKHSPSP